MTRRKWIILGAVLLLLTVGAELLVRPWNSPRGRVQIVNQADAAMDDLVLNYAESRIAVGRLKAGQSTTVWFSTAGKGTLTLEFNQKGNPMKGFQVQQFDPKENLRSGLKLVLVVKDNQIERFMDDDDSTTPAKSLWDAISGLFEPETAP